MTNKCFATAKGGRPLAVKGHKAIELPPRPGRSRRGRIPPYKIPIPTFTLAPAERVRDSAVQDPPLYPGLDELLKDQPSSSELLDHQPGLADLLTNQPTPTDLLQNISF